jgi:hypothetical protein
MHRISYGMNLRSLIVHRYSRVAPTLLVSAKGNGSWTLSCASIPCSPAAASSTRAVQQARSPGDAICVRRSDNMATSSDVRWQRRQAASLRSQRLRSRDRLVPRCRLCRRCQKTRIAFDDERPDLVMLFRVSVGMKQVRHIAGMHRVRFDAHRLAPAVV